MKHILIAGACTLVLASPSAGQNREERAHMLLASELRIVQQQQQELALAVAGLGQSLNEAFKTFNSRLDALDGSLRKAFADQGVEIKTIGTDVRGINERSRETITRLGELKEEIEALRRALLAMAQRPVTVVPVDPLDPNAPPPDISQAPVPDAPLPSALGTSAKRLFDTGFGDFAGSQYAAAIAAWQQVLKNYPDSESADDAQFHIGEAEFLQNRFEQAVDAYNAVIQNYPKSEWVPNAYYKLGVAHERLGRFDSARAAWQQLIKQFPVTTEAGMAKQSLGRIEKAGAKP